MAVPGEDDATGPRWATPCCLPHTWGHDAEQLVPARSVSLRRSHRDRCCQDQSLSPPLRNKAAWRPPRTCAWAPGEAEGPAAALPVGEGADPAARALLSPAGSSRDSVARGERTPRETGAHARPQHRPVTCSETAARPRGLHDASAPHGSHSSGSCRLTPQQRLKPGFSRTRRWERENEGERMRRRE